MIYIYNGIPGSGKDHHIRQTFNVKKEGWRYPFNEAIICSADDYFMKDGEYKFNPAELSNAHGACLRKFMQAIEKLDVPNVSLVVNNTNTTAIEIAPYYAIAQAFKLPVTLVTMVCEPQVAAKRNSHGVQLGACIAMSKRMDERRFPPFWTFAYSFYHNTSNPKDLPTECPTV
jgi:hypothetical protein